jgi:sortase A
MRRTTEMKEPANTLTPAPSPLPREGGRGRPSPIVERILLAAGLSALGLVALSHVEASLFQEFRGRRLEETCRLAGGVSPIGRLVHGPVGRIEIPRLGLSVVVEEGVDSGTLRLAAGHLPGSAFPGERGNVVIAGHRDSFFRPLKDIRPSDVIDVVTPSGVFRYRVRSTRVVRPDRIDVLEATDLPTLTLVTCFPFNFIGSAPKRFVVEARQIDPPIAHRHGERRAMATSASTMGDDPEGPRGHPNPRK